MPRKNAPRTLQNLLSAYGAPAVVRAAGKTRPRSKVMSLGAMTAAAHYPNVAGMPLNEHSPVGFWTIRPGDYQLWLRAEAPESPGVPVLTSFAFDHPKLRKAYEDAEKAAAPHWMKRLLEGTYLDLTIAKGESHASTVDIHAYKQKPEGYRLFMINVYQDGVPVGSVLDRYVDYSEADSLQVVIKA